MEGAPTLRGLTARGRRNAQRGRDCGEEPFTPFVVLYEGRALGLVNLVRFADAPDLARAYGVSDPGAVNCDVLIGDPADAHRGLGPASIEAFLDDLVFADPRATQVIIDPVPDNAIAIRAYEKVGFRFLAAHPDDGEGSALYLMRLTREEHERGLTPEALVVRPARSHELALADAIDDDAADAYRALGLEFDIPAEFHEMELERWARSAREGRLLFACVEGTPVALVALGHVSGHPHVEQLSVRRAFQGRGIGRALLERALRWSVREGELWLSTYASVPWNGPWYARMGFTPVRDEDAPEELRALLDAARGALPRGEDQLAMVCRGQAHARHRSA